MAIDPVCGMAVDEQKAPSTAVHNGATYYFCAPGCKRTFEKDPAAVLTGGPRGMGSPMGPPSVQMVTMMPSRTKAPTPLTPPPSLQGRGTSNAAKPVSLTIPIEGMSCASCVAKIEQGLSDVPGVVRASVNLATEKATVEYQSGVATPDMIQEAIRGLGYTPVMPAAREMETPASKAERKQAAYRDLRARFWTAAALTVPVMILSMSEHLRLPLSQSASFWLQFLLTTPIQF